MNVVKLLQRVNDAIAELEDIRKEILSEYPEWFNNVTMYNLISKKASVRLLNVMKHDEIGELPVIVFVQKIKRIDMFKYRGFGKLTMLELSKIIKEETGMDW